MNNLKENLIKKATEMEIYHAEEIFKYRGLLRNIKSGRNKSLENSLLRNETLKQFWENLKNSLEAGHYEN